MPDFDSSALLKAELRDHLAVAHAAADALPGPFAKLVDMVIEALAGGGKLVLFGNGGSAADAQHWPPSLR